MNEITTETVTTPEGVVDVKHYVLALDDEGNEIKIEVKKTDEFSQEAEEPAAEPAPTVH